MEGDGAVVGGIEPVGTRRSSRYCRRTSGRRCCRAHRSGDFRNCPRRCRCWSRCRTACCMSRRSLTFIQLSGILKGEEPVARCEGPVEIGEGLDRRAVLRPSRHRSVVQAQRECRIRIYPGAEGLEARGGDACRRGGDRRLDLVIELPAQRAGIAVDASGPARSSDRATDPPRLSRPARAVCEPPGRRASIPRPPGSPVFPAIPWRAGCAPAG